MELLQNHCHNSPAPSAKIPIPTSFLPRRVKVLFFSVRTPEDCKGHGPSGGFDRVEGVASSKVNWGRTDVGRMPAALDVVCGPSWIPVGQLALWGQRRPVVASWLWSRWGRAPVGSSLLWLVDWSWVRHSWRRGSSTAVPQTISPCLLSHFPGKWSPVGQHVRWISKLVTQLKSWGKSNRNKSCVQGILDPI